MVSDENHRGKTTRSPACSLQVDEQPARAELGRHTFATCCATTLIIATAVHRWPWTHVAWPVPSGGHDLLSSSRSLASLRHGSQDPMRCVSELDPLLGCLTATHVVIETDAY